MDNPIKGYRTLTAEEIALVNEIKEAAAQIGALAHKVERTFQVDGRWAAIGQTHLQQGFMALTRAVTRPTTF